MEGRVTCLTAEWPTLHLETEAGGFRESKGLGFMRPEILGELYEDELVLASEVGGTVLGLGGAMGVGRAVLGGRDASRGS